jgi:hypothetical protein
MMWEIVGLMHLLNEWKRMPDAPPSEYSCWHIHRNRHHRFTGNEIKAMRNTLKGLSPMAYYSVFPEEQPDTPGNPRPRQAGESRPPQDPSP